MTINQLASLQVGDRIKFTDGGDAWILRILEVTTIWYLVICESGPGGVGQRHDMFRRQTRRDAARYEKL